MLHSVEFTKDNLHGILVDLSKEFRKLNGKKTPAEIILVGGAAILSGYGFRDFTTDIDAIIRASSAMKQAINRVSDKYDLPNGWINTGFTNTDSYTPKLVQHSRCYHKFSNIMEVRVVEGEYLIAMKLTSGRNYKYDKSDIIGIMAEHQKRGKPIEYEDIDRAIMDLYGNWERVPKESRELLHIALSTIDLKELYEEYRQDEIENKAKKMAKFEQIKREKEAEKEKATTEDDFLELAKAKLKN